MSWSTPGGAPGARRLTAGPFRLYVDDPGRGAARGQRRRRAGHLGEGAAVHGEDRQDVVAAAIDQQVPAVGGQPGVDVSAAARDGGAADQGEGAVRVDGVAGDVARPGVDGEQVPAVMADLHPAGCGLPVGVRRSSDGGELAEQAVAVRGYRAQAGAVVRVADEQLRGPGRRELGAELAETLPGERRALRREQVPAGQHHEAVDLRRAGTGADQVIAERVEEDVTHT